jgi:DNA-binding MarR family transcriptional regulator
MSSTPEQDLTLLVTALDAAARAEVTRRIAAAGYPDLRPAHGYVFQHLVVGPARVTDLAHKLGMTAQGASKLVVDLERLGYVVRRTDPADRRNRIVELTPRGWAGIEAGRTARAAVTAAWRAALGEPAAEAFVAALHQLAVQSGGLRQLLERRLRPELSVDDA